MRTVGALTVIAFVLVVALTATTGAASHSTPAVRDGGTFRVAAVEVGSIDPALAGASAYVDASCALLLRGAGKPEVARGQPTVSRDGKTYTFKLRRTFRFSTGTPVTAASFAHAFDRLLSPAMQAQAAPYFSDIVGADDVLAGKRPHASGLRANGYTLTVRLRNPVPDFPARLTQPFACAVPTSLPATPDAVTAPASGAGPYYISEYVRGSRLVLRRNRLYRGSRPHHVDRIVVSIVGTNETALNEVLAGREDWVDAAGGTPPRALTPSEQARVRIVKGPALASLYVVMNSSRPLFKNNVRLRRAVNFALDREALLRPARAFVPVTATDQYIPAGMPGFRDAHLYPLRHPDVRRARALARRHTRTGHAVLYVRNEGPSVAGARIVKRDLARIGITVEIRQFPFDQLFARLANLREPYDLTMNGWTPAFVDPYDVLNSLLDGHQLRIPGNGNFARFNSPKYNRLLARAAQLRGAARYRAYGKLDVRLARDAAPLAATGTFGGLVLVSRRTRCAHLTPVGFLDLARVCLR